MKLTPVFTEEAMNDIMQLCIYPDLAKMPLRFMELFMCKPEDDVFYQDKCLEIFGGYSEFFDIFEKDNPIEKRHWLAIELVTDLIDLCVNGTLVGFDKEIDQEQKDLLATKQSFFENSEDGIWHGTIKDHCPEIYQDFLDNKLVKEDEDGQPVISVFDSDGVLLFKEDVYHGSFTHIDIAFDTLVGYKGKAVLSMKRKKSEKQVFVWKYKDVKNWLEFYSKWALVCIDIQKGT